jgi:hypothetical protein
MLEKKWVVILGGGKSQLPFINSSKKLGYNILVIDKDPIAIAIKDADLFLNISTHDSNIVLQKVIVLDLKIVGLIARTTGKALITAANLNKHFKLRGVNKGLAEISISKSLLREFLNQFGIKTPRGVQLTNIDNDMGVKLINTFKKIVIKPDITLVGKENIFLCKSKHDVINKFKFSKTSSLNSCVEVQKYIDGRDSSFLVWFEQGFFKVLLSLDEGNQFNSDSGVLEGKFLTMPATSLKTNEHLFVMECCNTFANIFHDISCLIAFSFRFDNKGNGYLIEIHSDLTGDSILDSLAFKSTNINFFDLLVKYHIFGFKSVDYKMKKVTIKL